MTRRSRIVLYLSRLPALAATLLITGCRADGVPSLAEVPAWCRDLVGGTGFATWDSVGIQIVANLSPAWPSGPDEREAVPQLVIGDVTGDPAYEFGRVGSAVRLGDGRIVVGDAQAAELKVYDPSGRFLGRSGGRGDGPGEFRTVTSLYRTAGDSLVVNDLTGRRITTLDAELRPVAVRPIPSIAFSRPSASPGGPSLSGSVFVQLRGRLADGSLLGAYNPAWGAQPTETMVTRDSLLLVRIPAEGEVIDSLGFILGSQRFLYFHPEGGPTPGAITFGETPLGAVESFAVGGDRYYHGRAEIFEIEERAPDGRLVRLIRLCRDPGAIDPADFERVIEGRLASMPEQALAYEEPAFRNLPPPTRAPAYLELRVDDAGRLWARDFTPPGEPWRWFVFDRDGRWLGAIRTPADVNVLQVGPDYLLGLHTDPVGVHSIRLLKLELPAP